MHPGTPPSPESFPGLLLLLQSRPDLDPAARELLLVLRAEAGPCYVTVDAFAERLGFSSRHVLTRKLLRLGLPSFSELHGWFRVLAMVAEAERHGASLSHLAFQYGGDPASWSRLVRRVTGQPWSAVSSRGMFWLVGQIGMILGGGGEGATRLLRPVGPRNDV